MTTPASTDLISFVRPRNPSKGVTARRYSTTVAQLAYSLGILASAPSPAIPQPPAVVDYNSITNLPELGTAASRSYTDFATAAQGQMAAEAQPLIQAGTEGQFYGGDKQWHNWVAPDWNASGGMSHIANKPTALSQFDNDVGFATTVQLNNYASVSDLGNKMNVPTGNSAQYVRGDGELAILPTKLSQFINDIGFVSGINADTIISALGYTPYSNANPSGFISAVTAQTISDALGFAPYSASNPSGFISGIDSNSVTAALGFTPYNATNPNNYINGITPTMIANALGYTPYSAANPAGYLSSIDQARVFAAIGYTPYNATNPSGYISNVVTALGYTPYNASNPAGYISGITASMINAALGYTAYSATNPAGYITGINQSMVVAALGFTPGQPFNRTFTTPTFASATTATQLSASRDFEVHYAFDAAVSISLLAGQSVTATLRYADNAGMNGNVVVVDSATTSNSGVLGLTQTNTLRLGGRIPAGKYRQVTFALSGGGATAPTTLKAGQESIA